MRKTKISLFILAVLVICCSQTASPFNKKVSSSDHSAVRPVPVNELYKWCYTPREWWQLHERINAIANKTEIDLVFLGDSHTSRWKTIGKRVWEKYYSKCKAANFGIQGDSTQHVLWRIQNGNFDGISPKLIVLMIGTNNSNIPGALFLSLWFNRRVVLSAHTYDGKPWSDVFKNSPQEIADGVAMIVQQLRKKVPKAKILLLGIFPRGLNSARKLAMRENNSAANNILKKIADGKTVYYRDIGEVFLNKDGGIAKELFMNDLIHLNEAGYQKWAEAIEKDVANLLGDNGPSNINFANVPDNNLAIAGEATPRVTEQQGFDKFEKYTEAKREEREAENQVSADAMLVESKKMIVYSKEPKEVVDNGMNPPQENGELPKDLSVRILIVLLFCFVFVAVILFLFVNRGARRSLGPQLSKNYQGCLWQRKKSLSTLAFTFFKKIGLPTTFEEMGLKNITDEALRKVAEDASKSPLIISMPKAREVPDDKNRCYDPDEIIDCMKETDALGRS